MKKTQKAKILDRIFEESEAIKYSEKELGQNLKEIDIDPDKLVKKGMNIVEKFLKGKEAKIIPIEKSSLNKFPIAASRKKPNLNTLFKKVKKNKK